ncbi:MAG: septal ring lytic transglycosylase RlpA family protein [Halioglobus sp.]|nr:septal ring lytic transglycosylase RlpA family protein [Halioglobus sp.]
MKTILAAVLLYLASAGIAWSTTVPPMEGIALHYSDRLQGKRTASGEVFDQDAMTAAYRSLPFGSKVKVTNLENGNSVVVTVNDRMASRNKNTIDVTRRAAQELGFEHRGKAQVSIELEQ